MERDSKINRALDLIEAFRGGAVLTSRQIAARYLVSQRTAQRLVLTAAEFVPLEDEAVPGDEAGSMTRVYRKARF